MQTTFPWLRLLRAVPKPTLGAAFVLSTLAPDVAQAQNFTVNTQSREEVRIFYNTVYQAAEGPVALNWSGNIATCTPGTISQSVRDRAQLRVNYYRAMAGLPTDVVFTPDLNDTAQAGAFLNSANKQTEHVPPNTWTCYTDKGAEGAKSNLIGGGSNTEGAGPRAIDTWMYDSSTGNEQVGHRRWIIYPPQQAMGFGEVPATNGFTSTSALYVFGPRKAQRPTPRDEFVAWPPPGFIPADIVSPRWSFSLPDADFSASTVTLTRNGAALPVTIQNAGGGGYGDPTLVWIRNDQIGNVLFNRPTADEAYTVAINNVKIGGASRNFTYNVTLIDPRMTGQDYRPAQVTGPDSPPLNQNTTYNFTTVPNATGYQWRASKLSPLNLTDGAENGMANWDAAVGNYNPIDTKLKVNGNSAFRLTRSMGGGVEQKLTFKKTVVAEANSQITFKSRTVFTGSHESRVEVSADEGANWTTVFSQTGAASDEGSFSDKVVSLSQFAGRAIRIRFNLEWIGGPTYVNFEPLGWYFDDVAFVNLQEVGAAPVVNTVTAGTSFNFNPTEQSVFDLSVRPQFFGQYFGEWGLSKRVSTLTGPPPNTASAPTIGTQPQGQTVAAGANATFTVAAQGTAPLAYVWKFNGTDLTDGANVQGSRTATLTLTGVQAAQAGGYTVQISNGTGNVTSMPATLLVNAPASLESALDTTGLTWTTGGNANWSAQTAVTHDNVDAAQSGRIGDSQESRLETTVTGPATVVFWWKVESEQNYDFLRLDLDGTSQFRISGNVNWETKSVAIPAGNHTLRWVYSKDASQPGGADTAWVDQVEVRPAQPSPSLNDALDADLPWATAGDRPWFAQINTTHDATDAVQSGPIGDSQSSRLEATVLGPANLSFWWKVDSEPGYDFLTFEVDNNRPFEPISGNVDWQQKTVPIPAGTHTIRWTYAKDQTAPAGADAGWVDQVVLTKLTPGEAGEPGPKIELAASGPKLRLTWPDTASGFKLQVASRLAPDSWTDVSENDISKDGGVFFIQLSTSTGTAFYRLVSIE